MRAIVRRILPVTLTAAFISACADAPTSSAPFVPFSPSLHVIPVTSPSVELVALCKVGPAGTYTFGATATHPVLRDEVGGGHTLMAATYTIVVAPGSMIDVGGSSVPGACYDFGAANHNHIALASGGTNATVTVVETGIPAGVDFQRVEVYQNTAGTVTMSSSTTNSASAQVGGPTVATFGASIVFYNVLEPTTGNQGCTPGYWKQDHHFDSWNAPYDPTDDFDATFGVNLFSPNITLLDALNLNGGKGGKNQLARAAVAALLNAAEGFSPMTEAQVIAAVQAAATSGDFEATKNIFAANNELGCPLN